MSEQACLKLYDQHLSSWSGNFYCYVFQTFSSPLKYLFVIFKIIRSILFCRVQRLALCSLNLLEHSHFAILQIIQDILIGLLRLRKCGRNVTCPELVGRCSIVRELHVYGTAVPVHGRDADKLQHQVTIVHVILLAYHVWEMDRCHDSISSRELCYACKLDILARLINCSHCFKSSLVSKLLNSMAFWYGILSHIIQFLIIRGNVVLLYKW